MDGDIAPLDKLYEVCERYGVITMVDDAHGEGVVGRGGRGIVDHFGLHGKFDVEIGTLSKAFGVVGGVIAGKKVLVDWMRQRGRPFLFSSATTAADTAACLAAVDLLEESTELVDRLWANARLFKAEMAKLGFNTGHSATPITPVILGENQVAQQFSRKLFERGIFAMPIVFPTVPKGTARIRVMISASHTSSDLEQGLEAFQDSGQGVGRHRVSRITAKGGNMERIYGSEIGTHVGERVRLSGWLHNLRALGKLNFLQLRDASGIYSNCAHQSRTGPARRRITRKRARSRRGGRGRAASAGRF